MENDDLGLHHETAFDRILSLFSERSYWQRLAEMFRGLRQPKDSGEYFKARVELQRQWAPLTALLIPSLCILLLVLFANAKPAAQRAFETEIIEAEEIKQLEKIEEDVPPPDDIQPMDVTFTPDISMQTQVQDAPMSPQPQTFDTVLTVKSPVILRNIYGSTRNAGMRGSLLGQGGGNAATEAAVMRALRWLKKNQRDDGAWGHGAVRSAMTGLAILSFLAHGETPGESREFGETVERAIQFLISSQDATGRWRGNYHHPIATYAMCEAYGMTMNPNVRISAEKGIEIVLQEQHASGGWNYFGQDVPDRDDTSVMGWAAQALKAAQMANVMSDTERLDRACKLSNMGFIKNAHANGGFGYTEKGRTGLSGIGVLCMQFHGAANRPEVTKTLEFMDPWKPLWNGSRPGAVLGREDRRPEVGGLAPGGNTQYYYYYVTQAKYQAGGARWENWNKTMWPEYVKAQFIEEKAIEDADGKLQDIGWWQNSDGSTDRPVMDTCLAALQLMVYYRYLPTFKAVEVAAEVAATAEDSGDIKVVSDI